MYLSEDRLNFRSQRSGPNPYRLMVWLGMILFGLWMIVQIDAGEIEPLFQPTPTPTRTSGSFAQEGQALFMAGDLNGSIAAYKDAVEHNPADASLMAELARIQTYASALLTTDGERAELLQEALEWVNQAAELAPRDSYVHAIRAFVLDWNANGNLVDSETREDLLFQAENAAGLAIQFDATNLLAQTYYAEVLLDQQKWDQAQQTMQIVLDRDPQFMDAYRVQGLVLETLGLYRDAIEAYEMAAEFTPNMTFLYLFIGYNYRQLQVYDAALEYFDRAANINKAINVQDPLPYIAIAKTYAQQGEFFIAARNAERALEFNPYNSNTYGQLGIIYVQARNYESAIMALKCATYGCTAAENEVSQTIIGEGVDVPGLPMTSFDVVWYYVRYSSVLAALDKCTEALPIINEIERNFGSDALIADIMAENRTICAILDGQ